MTTITSNGYYLIADKCVTSTTRKVSGNKNAMSATTDVYKTTNNVKIHVIENMDYTYKGAKILAYAVTGEATAGEHFMEAAEGIPLGSFARAYTKVMRTINTEDKFRIIAVTDLFETLVINVYGEVEDHACTMAVNITRHPRGVSVGAGSGAALSNTLLRSNWLNQDSLNQIHILHHHLFLACHDVSNSSISYDVYGVKQGKLVTDLKPEPEAVLESFQIVKDLIDIKPLAVRD